MCTNRADTLDPALLRPGRLDRKIEFPQPGRREKRLIFQVGTAERNSLPWHPMPPPLHLRAPRRAPLHPFAHPSRCSPPR